MTPSRELESLIQGYFRSFTTGDPSWVERHVWSGEQLRLIGTSAEEWVGGSSGYEMFLNGARDADGSLTAELDEVEAFSFDDVGWGAGRVRFSIGDGRSARARFSMVFARVDGVWWLVSSHASLPVSDDEAFAVD